MAEAMRACLEKRVLWSSVRGVDTKCVYLASPALPAGYHITALALLMSTSSSQQQYLSFVLAGSPEATAATFASGSSLIDTGFQFKRSDVAEMLMVTQSGRSDYYRLPQWRLIGSGPTYVLVRNALIVQAASPGLALWVELERWGEVFIPRGPSGDGSE